MSASIAPRLMTENREDRLRGGTASPLKHTPRHSQVSQQRTSAVAALRGQAFGFTLLEILIVLVLIAVLTSVISLSTARDPRQSLTEQAQRLGLLLTLAGDLARRPVATGAAEPRRGDAAAVDRARVGAAAVADRDGRRRCGCRGRVRRERNWRRREPLNRAAPGSRCSRCWSRWS